MMGEAEQLAEVKRRTTEYLSRQPEMFGDLILHKNNYQIFKLDKDREIHYNKESVRILPTALRTWPLHYTDR